MEGKKKDGTVNDETGPRFLRIMFRILAKLRFNFDQRLLIFLFFLILSTIFWFLNELNQPSISTLTFPVRYENLPADKVVSNDLPVELEFRMQAPGYTLIRYMITGRGNPVSFNIKDLPIRTNLATNPPQMFILTDYTLSMFNEQFPQDVKILKVLPDTVFFEFDDIVRKKVPVMPKVQLQFSKQYLMKDKIKVSPDSIIVSGPKAVLDTMVSVDTREIRETNVDKSFEQTVQLEQKGSLTYSRKRVLVSVAVEQFTEVNIKLPLEQENVPDTLKLLTFPKDVKLSCLVALSDYEKIEPHLFRVKVDYNTLDESISNKLKVILDKSPDYIKSVKLFPVNVEYIIEIK